MNNTPAVDMNRSVLRWLSGLALVAGNVAVQAADAAKAAPVSPLEPMPAGSIMSLIFGLLVVLALIVALAWFMRRVGKLQGGAAGSLRVLGGLSMGTRERVVLIQVGEKQLLLGVAPGRVQTLHVLDEPVQVPAASESANTFAANLSAALQRGKRS